jgi:hypothetical protein
MLIRIASLYFNIDDNLLMPETIQYFAPYVTEEPCSRDNPAFEVRLLKNKSFLDRFAPTVKLETINYQESGSTIIVVDHFSTFRIDLDKKQMGVLPTNDRYLKGLDFISDLKLLLSIAVLDTGGVLLHSSAVCRNGAAFVFSGRSGAGKSTIAQLLGKSWNIINDEFNILIPCNGRVLIYTTPFGTIKSIQTAIPSVQCIFSIQQSTSNTIEAIPDNAVMMSLLKNICTFPVNDYYGNKLFENVHFLQSMLTVKQLCFSNNESFSNFFETINSESIISKD